MGVKFFKFDWSYLDRLAEIQPDSLDEIRRLLRCVGTSDVSDPLRTFFAVALRPHYCPSWGPAQSLPALAGNVLYRLSDLVPLERRESMHLFDDYPSGSFTLEDWRQLWLARYEKGEESIPYFAEGEPIALPGLADGR
jgi:hypothetical protein